MGRWRAGGMKTIIDLTMPVEAHFRWPVERKLVGSFEREDDFQITWIGMGVHGFTHLDAPRHMVPSGGTTSDIGLDRIVGEAGRYRSDGNQSKYCL